MSALTAPDEGRPQGLAFDHQRSDADSAEPASAVSVRHDYHYETLSIARNEIRLLEILPAVEWDDRVHISLVIWPIAEAQEYAALSYTWGDTLYREEVIIEGIVKEVTINCHYALRQLRHQVYSGRSRYFYFWIDAICIDQSKTEERSHQVNIMNLIFSQAQHVYVSLGPHDTGSDSLFDIAAQARSNRSRLNEWLTSEVRVNRCWDTAYLEYWNRAWIVQEVVLAKDISICRGETSCVPWNVLMHLLERTRSTYSYIHERAPMRATGALREEPSQRYDEYTPHIDLLAYFELDPTLFPSQKLPFQRKCADPRDLIFSILGLIHWPKDAVPLEADYSLSRMELLRRLLDVLPTDFYTIRSMANVLMINNTDTDLLEQVSVLDQECMSAIQLVYQSLHDNSETRSSTSLHLPEVIMEEDDARGRRGDFWKDGRAYLHLILETWTISDNGNRVLFCGHLAGMGHTYPRAWKHKSIWLKHMKGSHYRLVQFSMESAKSRVGPVRTCWISLEIERAAYIAWAIRYEAWQSVFWNIAADRGRIV